MRSLLIGLLIGVSTIATADPRDWAKRIPCELQTAGVASLPTLEVLQGSSPLIACDQYRSGKALTVTNDVQAVMRFSSSLTNTLWVSVTNQSYYSNSYLIQLPSLGTNATSWVYTILYYKDSAIYWTGTGRLDIKKTEVAGSALQFVQVVGCITTNDINSAISTHNTNLTSHATLLSSYVTQAMTNGWTVSAHLDWLVRSETNGWVVAPHQAWLTAETDPHLAPALSALSNVVNTASVKSTSSAGSTLNSLSGAECLRWGVGSSCAISTTDGFNVGGALTALSLAGNGSGLTNIASSNVKTSFTPTNYTASSANVEAHLGGIDASMSAPYKTFTSTITPANGTATVVYAHGNMPSLTITEPTVITLDPTSYGTSGVSRVSLNFYSGTNSVTLATNVITYATTPTISTNAWNTILIRRVSDSAWKGVGL